MNVHSLAAWFDIPMEASGPNDDEAREAVLMEASKATAYSEEAGTVLFDCPRGRVLFSYAPGTPDKDDEPIVTFIDYVEKGRWARIRFWMNTSSIRDLLERRRSLPRVDFTQLLCTE
jgi:hypothetical protein